MSKNANRFQQKQNVEYSNRQKVIIYTIGALIFASFVVAQVYRNAESNDALTNGQKITIKINNVISGRTNYLSFHYNGNLCEVTYYPIDNIDYKAGDNVSVLYSKSYDFFLIERPNEAENNTVLHLAILLILVIIMCGLFRLYDIFSKKAF